MKRWLSLLLAIAMLLLMASCANTQTEEPDPEPEIVEETESEPVIEVPDPEPEPELESEVTGDFVNPLTGEVVTEDISANRPVMVMLNNVRQSLPQSGNGQADIIYEILEEGGITRMLGVYQDISQVQGNLGTIRSTRPYYVYLVAGMDGILVHAGGSTAAYDAIDAYQVTTLDALSGAATSLFWRDSARRSAGYATEHTMYITASDIVDYLAEGSVRTEHEEDFSVQQTFVEDGTPADGSDANIITVPFSGYKTGIFTYDAGTGKYLVSEYDEPYVDETTGEQVSVENVLIIMTLVSQIEGDSKGRLDVTMTGNGIGYYACNGKYIPINWSRSTLDSQYQFTTMDGEPLSLGVGKSYVNIVPTTCSVSFVS